MLVYCGNNPVMFIDPKGLCTRCYTCGILHACDDEWCINKYKGFVYRREVAVLRNETNMYYGVPVVRVPIEKKYGFTFDVIYLGKNVDASEGGIELLRHEYGHILQQEELGRLGYITFIVVPSVLAFISSANLPMEYTDFPTEYVADLLANVSREGHNYIMQELAIVYWEIAKFFCG